MRNKDFENFTKTGSIKDYLKYKNNQKNGDSNGSKGRNSNKSN
jgi:hypothetical protein